jgi:hypothetical protein
MHNVEINTRQNIPFKKGDKVQGIIGSRLAGIRGTIAECGVEWSFVNMDDTGYQEYTKTALLRIADTNYSDSLKRSSQKN